MNEYQERKRRDRRVQVPPLSYWQKYEEMNREETEFCRAVTELMDKLMKPFLYIVVPVGLIALITFHAQAYWLPGAVAAGLVVWWLIGGRKKYE